jgi:hypothetical protein
VGNADGVFDCVYGIGQDARIEGTSTDTAEAVRQYLDSLTSSDKKE